LQLRVARSFSKAVARLRAEQKTKARLAVTMLVEDERNPKLRFKRLRGADYWSARIDDDFRIILIRDPDEVFRLIDACNHAVYTRKYAVAPRSG
jgi:mRNA-degrading endonuclease YafQ of YafQ-DinJ toxin-antitoxin module